MILCERMAKHMVVLVVFCLTHYCNVPAFCVRGGKEMVIFLMAGSQLFLN